MAVYLQEKYVRKLSENKSLFTHENSFLRSSIDKNHAFMDQTNQANLVLCRLFSHFLFTRYVSTHILKVCIGEEEW